MNDAATPEKAKKKTQGLLSLQLMQKLWPSDAVTAAASGIVARN